MLKIKIFKYLKFSFSKLTKKYPRDMSKNHQCFIFSQDLSSFTPTTRFYYTKISVLKKKTGLDFI